MKTDFVGDIRQVLVDALSACAKTAGRKKIERMTAFELLVCYQNWQQRSIFPSPRKLIESDEFLLAKQNPSFAFYLSQLLDKMRNGDSMLPHLSKWVLTSHTPRQPTQPFNKRSHLDLLLNEWGIHHLHMSNEADPNDPRFVERGDSLLYAIFRQKEVYLIDILSHADFANDHLIRIVIKNWPDRGLVRKVEGATAQRGYGVEERKFLRSAAIDIPIVIGNDMFISWTGGLNAGGTSSINTLDALGIVKRIQVVEEKCKDRCFLMGLYAAAGQIAPLDPDLRLSLGARGFSVVDRQLGVTIYHL